MSYSESDYASGRQSSEIRRPNVNARPLSGGSEHRPSSRASKLAHRKIDLTHTDPLERLQQLARQGVYNYVFRWDKFENGVMCTIELYYQLNASFASRKEVDQVSRFVSSSEFEGRNLDAEAPQKEFSDALLEYAQKQVAAILLDRLGLGVEESTTNAHAEEDELNQASINNLAKTGIKMISAIMEGHLPHDLSRDKN
jgi:hypothetical protein